jgi:hypothetical protein
MTHTPPHTSTQQYTQSLMLRNAIPTITHDGTRFTAPDTRFTTSHSRRHRRTTPYPRLLAKTPDSQRLTLDSQPPTNKGTGFTTIDSFALVTKYQSLQPTGRSPPLTTTHKAQPMTTHDDSYLATPHSQRHRRRTPCTG